MPTESDTQARILRLGRGDVRLARVNAGKSWQGRASARPGGVWLEGGRPVMGAPVGTPDVVGCVSVVVTPEMIGQRVAVAVGIEVKKPKGKTSPEQRAWLDMGAVLGVRCGVARSVADAEAILRGEVWAIL